LVSTTLNFLRSRFDVAVDRAVVHVHLIVIGRIHEGVAALHHAGTLRQRLQDQEFGDREGDGLTLPGAVVALRIHHELTALERLGVHLPGGGRHILRGEAAQHRLHALDEETLGEGFADEVVRAHLEAEELVDLLVLRGQEDHRQVRFLPRRPEQLHAVHARHLDVEDREVRRRMLQPSRAEAPSV
jgi:hypothetical protein